MRIEHWDVAFNQGKTAALNMLGRAWSTTRAVLLLRPRGLVVDGVRRPGSGETVIRGSLEDGEFAAFYLDDGRVTAALSVGRSDDLEHARRFITERARPDPRPRLPDADSDLGSL